MKIKPISSRDNAVYKHLKLLASSTQARKKEGLSVLDGAHLVGVYLEKRGAPAWLAVSESGMRKAEIARLVKSAGVDVQQMSDALFHSISTVEHETGLMAAIETPEEPLPPRVSEDCLLLEQIQDPGNMGSLLRSAAAAGVRRVFCSPQTVYAWSPKVLRAGQGAHFSLTIVEGVELALVIGRLQVPLIATSSHAASAVHDLDLKKPVAWVFGNEGAGVSQPVLAAAQQRAMIPMPGGAESLNVAAAAAVCLFEAVRQRRAGRAG